MTRHIPKPRALCLLLGSFTLLSFSQNSAPPLYSFHFPNAHSQGKLEMHYYVFYRSGSWRGGEGNLAKSESIVSISSQPEDSNAVGLVAEIYQRGCQIQLITVEDLKRDRLSGFTARSPNIPTAKCSYFNAYERKSAVTPNQCTFET